MLIYSKPNGGHRAEIKVDTFNFTRYGLLHGEVLGVSSDAITRDKQQNAPNDRTAGAATSTSEPKGQELEYAARVSLDRTDRWTRSSSSSAPEWP
jgi:hemolysin D